MNFQFKVLKELESYTNIEKRAFFPKFFKTGRGEYGEGDLFLGVTVPNVRKVAAKNYTSDLSQIESLLSSKYHEVRMAGLFILVSVYQKNKNEAERKTLLNFYLKNTIHINNWDLVDLSCYKIVGDYLKEKDKRILLRLSKSSSLWERRISIVSTYAFIKSGNLDTTFEIASDLLDDNQDLIHKAVGWMLREAGKVDEESLVGFLDANASKMPRTTLRYAIERLSESDKKRFLSVKKI